MKLLGWVYLAAFSAVGTVALFLDVLSNSLTPSWVMGVLAGAAVGATVAGARGAAWSHGSAASGARTRPPWWWYLLLSAVILSGPLLRQLVVSVPLVAVIFMLGAALLFGLSLFLVANEWRTRRENLAR